jgi:hypothetical protein
MQLLLVVVVQPKLMVLIHRLLDLPQQSVVVVVVHVIRIL